MSEIYRCNLVMPGAAKSGTSSLHELLDQHPDIEMSSKKEPHHFSRRERFEAGAAAHNALFEGGGEPLYCGESSTSYMISEAAIARIRESLVDPKIIILLRDPVERTFSHYRWRYTLGLEDREFLDALREDGYAYDPEQTHGYGYRSYLQFSRYGTYVPKWVSAFGEDNVLIVSTQSLKSDPAATFAKCVRFLDLSDTGFQREIKANVTETLTRRSFGPASLVARFVPRQLKGAAYGRLRNAMAKRIPKRTLRRELLSGERAFLEEELAEDIHFFRTVLRAA